MYSCRRKWMLPFCLQVVLSSSVILDVSPAQQDVGSMPTFGNVPLWVSAEPITSPPRTQSNSLASTSGRGSEDAIGPTGRKSSRLSSTSFPLNKPVARKLAGNGPKLDALLDALEASAVNRKAWGGDGDIFQQSTPQELSGRALATSLASMSSMEGLIRAFREHGKRFEIKHVAMMMVRLARLESSCEQQSRIRSSGQKLWSQLVEKAIFLMHDANLRDVIDVLVSLHRMASLREQLHVGEPSESSASASSQPRSSPMKGGSPVLQTGSNNDETPNDDLEAILPRPLRSSRSLRIPERDLARSALRRSLAFLTEEKAEDLQRLVAVVSRLSYAPGMEWQQSFFSASLHVLPQLDARGLVSLSCSIARLQPSCMPGPSWMAGFFDRTLRVMHQMDPRALCILSTAVSRLPKPHPDTWIQALLQRGSECLDSFDAPAYALLLHAAGRMKKQRVPRAWVQEVLESSTSLLYDFTAGEGDIITPLLTFTHCACPALQSLNLP